MRFCSSHGQNTQGSPPNKRKNVAKSFDRLQPDEYDANGNTISSAGIENQYDFENRLLRHGDVTIVYDGDGNRVAETAGGVTTSYLVDTQNPTGYAQISAVVKRNDIEVKVTLVNRGTSAFPLLKWNLPANGRLTDGSLFSIRRDGTEIAYQGVQIKRAVSDSDYVPLEVGREYTTTIGLAQGYDVRPKGRYTIQYRAWNSAPDGSGIISFQSNVVEVTRD